MKKVLYLAFSVLLLSVMCFSVMPARAEVTFNGQWRVRGFAFDIDGAKDQDVTNKYWDQRFRLYITAKVSDNLKGVVRMLTPNHASCDLDLDGTSGSAVGNRWGTSVDPREVLWDVAYLDITCPITGMNFKLGRQGIDLGNFIVLGSCKTYDSLVISKSLQNNVDLSLFAAKLYEGTTSASNDEDIYGLVLNFDPAPNMNLGAFFVLGNDGDASGTGYLFDGAPATHPDADAYWAGLTANMDLSPIKVKLEVDYSSLTANGIAGNQDMEATGYAFFGDVSADLDMAKVGANILYTTGHDEDDTSTTESDQFVPISSYFSERMDYDYIVMRTYLYADPDGILDDATDWSINNLTVFQLYAMKDLTPKLNGKVSIQKYAFTEDPDGSANPLGDDLGMELDVKLTYRLYDNLALTGVGAYWLTESDTFGDGNDDCWLLKHEILYTF